MTKTNIPKGVNSADNALDTVETMVMSLSPESTRLLGYAFAGHMQKPRRVLLMTGPLGAGKTCFIQGLAKGLGVNVVVQSPTYKLVAEYELPIGKANGHDGGRLYHLDCYRTDAGDALLADTIDEFLESSRNLLVVEWADRLPSWLKLHCWRIDMQYIDEHIRGLCYTRLDV